MCGFCNWLLLLSIIFSNSLCMSAHVTAPFLSAACVPHSMRKPKPREAKQFAKTTQGLSKCGSQAPIPLSQRPSDASSYLPATGQG